MLQRARLGLVCITSSERCRFRTITRTQYLLMSKSKRARICLALVVVRQRSAFASWFTPTSSSYERVPWIEVEARGKECAITALRQQTSPTRRAAKASNPALK